MLRFCLPLFPLLLLTSASADAQPPAPKKDRLPPGAALRLGSARLRHLAAVTSLAFAPDGKSVASADTNGVISVWEVPSGASLLRLPKGTGTTLAFAPDGKVLATAGWGGALRLFTVATGKEVLQINAWHGLGSVLALAFSPDGKVLATATPGQVIRLWSATTGKEIGKLEGHNLEVWSLAFSRDGKTLASGDGMRFAPREFERPGPNVIILWDVEKRKERRRFAANPGWVYRLDFSRDGKTLASASPYDVRLWETASGKQLHRFHAGPRDSVAFSPVANVLVAGGELSVWDAAEGRKLLDVGQHKEHVQAVAVSPDGKVLASGDRAGQVRLWSATTGKELGVPRGPRHPVVSVAFSPDGNLAVAGSAGDRAVFLWGTASGAQLRKLDLNCTTGKAWCGTHDASVVFFAPDGKTVASRSCDGVIHLWDLETGKERSFPVGERWVNSVAFDPTGKTVASLYSENGVRSVVGIYDLATGREQRQDTDHGLIGVGESLSQMW
jgi:WD40 repeat protein